ncbi:hypothetical protein COCC4DRAFT_64295 [Bipolaris maydis ATCC 48331]|uniref:Uncharacterized protein n=2 Tax=Cochliobolus heterostrophus TaxID=5016 RepID=M2V463_COCH5|nr:uncharacterized protein COCC4DRAFT_64295 [Bipolaris maydis ATCC 48331]EMD94793.1 hypothetical protein COCHEDRAFT_1152655 [Bipolaris maydis C5]ENI01496.1 hypothetical protein COCC4DRAFT_64295 [Bipolaris maydis ATCC 48331]KAH7556013.1 hypothetical protein BM1_06539 [Bipolaris maydis]
MLGTHGPAQALEGLDGERDDAWVDEVDKVKRRSDESMWIPPDRAYLKTRSSKGTVKDLELSDAARQNLFCMLGNNRLFCLGPEKC